MKKVNNIIAPSAEWALSFQCGRRGLRVGEFVRSHSEMNRSFLWKTWCSPWLLCGLLAAAAADFGFHQIPRAALPLQIVVATIAWIGALATSTVVAVGLGWIAQVCFRRAWPVCTLVVAIGVVLAGRFLRPDQHPYNFDPAPNQELDRTAASQGGFGYARVIACRGVCWRFQVVGGCRSAHRSTKYHE